jgi:hypothetical protein
LSTISMEEFNMLSVTVKEALSPETFVQITAESIPMSDIDDLLMANTKLCVALSASHVDDPSVEIPPSCARFLPNEAWTAYVEKKAALPVNILSHEDGRHLADGQWIKRTEDHLTKKHWSKVGLFSSPEDPHPCRSIDYAFVKGVKNFWSGINAACLANLPFLETIEEEDLKLIDPRLLATIPAEIRSKIIFPNFDV